MRIILKYNVKLNLVFTGCGLDCQANTDADSCVDGVCVCGATGVLCACFGDSGTGNAGACECGTTGAACTDPTPTCNVIFGSCQ